MTALPTPPSIAGMASPALGSAHDGAANPPVALEWLRQPLAAPITVLLAPSSAGKAFPATGSAEHGAVGARKS